METKIFDRETMLDLVVNFIPLGIILFFITVFVVVTPWGFDVRTSGVMLGLMIVPFVALAVLTYLSAKAIAGDEKTNPVYAQGQAGLAEAEPKHHGDDDHAAEEPINADDIAADSNDDEDGDNDDKGTNSDDSDGDSETTDKQDSDDPADDEPAA